MLITLEWQLGDHKFTTVENNWINQNFSLLICILVGRKRKAWQGILKWTRGSSHLHAKKSHNLLGTKLGRYKWLYKIGHLDETWIWNNSMLVGTWLLDDSYIKRKKFWNKISVWLNLGFYWFGIWGSGPWWQAMQI